jgi:hypothetical protein
MSNTASKIISKGIDFTEKGIKRIKRKISANRNFSHLDEQSIINHYLEKLKIDKGYCADIAASDGITMSNTYSLYRNGWHGVAVEFDAQKFSNLSNSYVDFQNVNLVKCMVTPINVISLLEANTAPVNFDFLNLDIDGYDYFVLEKILQVYRPKLICVEINEKIPPPIKFAVKWDKNYAWATDHFYGQSISQLNMLINQHKYSLVELHYNNAFLIPTEISPAASLTPEEAYRVGYLEKTDRKSKFPWNSNMEDVLYMEPQEALDFINNFFSKYHGAYDASI